MKNLEQLFISVLNMSITASYVAIGVILVRMLLRRAPKIFSYALWAVVLFRLTCPLSFAGIVSEYAPGGDTGLVRLVQTPAVQSGIDSIIGALNSSLPHVVQTASAVSADADPSQIWMAVLSLVWLAGIIVLLAYSVLSYVRLKIRLKTATITEDGIFNSDRIDTPFVFGFIKPKIYVPISVGGAELSYILEHERTHIRRRDYLIKPLAFLALIIHWFNPLMWLSFRLMSRDLEMSCDESVLRNAGKDSKYGYSGSMLSLSVKRAHLLTANPLAFGENHIKARIKNVLNYKKPAFWVIVIAIVAVFATGVFAAFSGPQKLAREHSDSAADTGSYTGSDTSSDTGSNTGSNTGADTDKVSKLVEENLDIIMSSPLQSSNPYDYINAHKNEYENIIKYGGEDALQYMLAQFETGNAEGLRGALMMRLCKELLGARNNVTGEQLTPQEWYDALDIRVEIDLPDYTYDGDDLIEKLVYATETEKYSDPGRGFTVVAPKIFAYYEEEGLLKVFVTTYSATYRLYGNVVDMVSGGVVPSAITYKKDDSGKYTLTGYQHAQDGSHFAPSIRKFCTMPSSGKQIPGLADKILKHYSDYGDIRALQRDNLNKHLKANGITAIVDKQ